MLEWQELPRSLRAKHGDIEFDVWQIGGEGWRLNVKRTNGTYIATEGGFRDAESACAAAIKFLTAKLFNENQGMGYEKP